MTNGGRTFANVPQEELSPKTAESAAQYAMSTLVWFGAASGLRLGEMRALRRSACHLRADIPFIEVVEAVSDVYGDADATYQTGAVFGDPKSHEARAVYLPASVASILQEHLDTRVRSEPDALVFVSPRGGVMNPNNFRHRVWKPVVAAAKIDPAFGIHHLRHTCGSPMARAGVPIHEVKEHLGTHLSS
jgi:integrase